VHASRVALTALVAANLVPLFGVAFLGWRLYDVMLIYWLENGVIGAFTVLRMATAAEERTSALAFVPFFTVHYGLFWLVHGVFVVTLFGTEGPFGAAPGAASVGPQLAQAGGPSMALPIVGAVPVAQGAALAAVGLVVSHGVSFARNWLAAGERDGRSPSSLMRQPYGRVAVLHVTLLVAAFAVMALGAPIAALAFMVVLKIVLDAAAHLREHRRAPA